jgi:hypothetical protein
MWSMQVVQFNHYGYSELVVHTSLPNTDEITDTAEDQQSIYVFLTHRESHRSTYTPNNQTGSGWGSAINALPVVFFGVLVPSRLWYGYIPVLIAIARGTLLGFVHHILIPTVIIPGGMEGEVKDLGLTVSQHRRERGPIHGTCRFPLNSACGCPTAISSEGYRI